MFYDVVALFDNLPEDAKSVLDEYNYYKNEDKTLKCCYKDIYEKYQQYAKISDYKLVQNNQYTS